ncbi:hypothetical protein [Sphingobacterium detergens]|uniref:Uncharacterized protein n=1 Tax=Sphingobacterium detergens TaxID=1145106 RepID=A0A420ARP7_SPHD1|nr:hypothetical protein [Sphingobacterium detergens]RKE47105.1 hypothetical protein DFQ12_4266 [Sphingobacterium detergens]
MDQIRRKHDELINLIEEINKETNRFNGTCFFIPPSLKISFNSFEVCFKDYVLYLYSLFIELPGINLKFVDKKIKDFGIPLSDYAKRISRLVQDLRTVNGHYTSLEKAKDREKINACEDWYEQTASVKSLEKEEDYQKCANALLNGTIEYLVQVLLCIQEFSKIEFPDIVKNDWQRESTRFFTKYEWEKQLQHVLELYGMNHYDPYVITEKEIGKWNAQLKILKEGFVFQIESKKIIERYLAQEEIWPASAEDLHALGVEYGPSMGEMVKKCKKLYYESPCKKAELLMRFKKKYLNKL